MNSDPEVVGLALWRVGTSLGHDSGGASDSVPRRWHGGVLLGLVLGSTVPLGAFGWLLHVFCVMVFSDPEVDSTPSKLQLFHQLVTLGNWTPRPRASRT